MSTGKSKLMRIGAYMLYVFMLVGTVLLLSSVSSLAELTSVVIYGTLSLSYWIMCFLCMAEEKMPRQFRQIICFSSPVVSIILLALYILLHSRVTELLLDTFLLGAFWFFGRIFMQFTKKPSLSPGP